MISLLIKFVLIAVSLAVGAVVVMQSTGGTNVLGGLTSKTTTTEALEDLDIIDTVSKVLPAVTDIPSLTPLINTKNNIQRSVESIISLPQEEKAALCKQVCSP
ncbi:MAG: hypothetical protein Q7S60_01680 [bacterium]|nr:hypothetical protein [bacterium]